MFRPCFTDSRVLACMAYVLGDFKLSSLNFRAALPGQGHQNLHTDWGGPVEPGEYQVCNAIWLLDDFTASNGATRVVPGSHRARTVPRLALPDPAAPHPDEVLVTGPVHRRRLQQPPMARRHPEPQRPRAARHALLLHPPRSRPATGPEEGPPPADPDRPQPRRPLHPGRVVTPQFTVRPASVADARPMAELFAAVAEERSGIASEPPVDVEQRTAQFTASIAESIVAVADGQVVGMIHTDVRRYGVGELGMLVDCDWRGRGVGSALIQATIAWARDQGLHKPPSRCSRTTRPGSPCTASPASPRKATALSTTGGPTASSGTPSSWACRSLPRSLSPAGLAACRNSFYPGCRTELLTWTGIFE